MSNPSAAAATARQRLASVLGALQQDPSCPPGVLEIVGGLAKAMGPLFQLERGATDLQLFVQARTVLQQTLEKIQTVDQDYPGVGDATSAIAQCLGIIFAAMRDAGMVGQPGSGAQPSVAPAAAPAQPSVAPEPVAQPTSMQPPPAAQPVVQPSIAPVAQPAAFAATQFQPAPAAQPAPVPQPAPVASPIAAPAPGQNLRPGAPTPHRTATYGTGTHSAPTATVPVGPNGLPRLEGEVGVHSETNFFTDFLGDIRNHGGIFVATFHVLPMAAPCEVLLTFPGNLTAEIRGVVRWKRESDPGASLASSPGLGIEITQASNDAWGLIERFMRKREPIMHEM